MPKDRRDSKNAELEYKLIKSIEKVINRYSNKYEKNKDYCNFLEFLSTVRCSIADRHYVAYIDYIDSLTQTRMKNFFKKRNINHWYNEEMKDYKEALIVAEQRNKRLATLAKWSR